MTNTPVNGAGEPAQDDRSLLIRTRDGDAAAFGGLVERYMRRAYFSALGLVGSHDDALDLSQDAFVRAYRNRDRIDPDRPFFTYLYQILRRLCFNFLRDRRVRDDLLTRAVPWLQEDARGRAAEGDPARLVERSELRDRIERALDTLVDTEREVLVLREFGDLRYREIAEVVGIPIGTVMSRLYAARRHLAEVLGDLA